METEYNGSMRLMQIKRIFQRNMGLNTVYHISFINDKRKLIATKYHCFINDDNKVKRIDELESKENIWVMISELSQK